MKLYLDLPIALINSSCSPPFPFPPAGLEATGALDPPARAPDAGAAGAGSVFPVPELEACLKDGGGTGLFKR